MYIKSIQINNKNQIEKYVSELDSINSIKELTFHKPITFFVGENGTGKSTLLEAIAISWGFNPEGGSKNFIFSTRNSHSNFYKNVKIIKGPYRPRDGYFLRSESFYNLATNIDDMDNIICQAPPVKDSYGGKSLHTMSHGEGLLALIFDRFRGNGIYMLDEPEMALSPLKQLSVLSRIYELSIKQNSQFIIITHSPILMTCPESEIYLFDDNEIKIAKYHETDHYVIAKQFLNSPDNMLSKLL